MNRGADWFAARTELRMQSSIPPRRLAARGCERAMRSIDGAQRNLRGGILLCIATITAIKHDREIEVVSARHNCSREAAAGMGGRITNPAELRQAAGGDIQGQSDRKSGWTKLNGQKQLSQSATICNNLQQSATICNNLQQSATICNNLQQSSATICNNLQQSATIRQEL